MHFKVICYILIITFLSACQSKREEGLKAIISKLNADIDLHQTIENLEYLNDGRYLDLSLALLNEDGDTLSLEDLNIENKIFLRFHYSDCNVCIKQELACLSPRFSVDNVIILAEFESLKKLKLFKASNGIKYPIYITLDSSKFPEALEGFGSPYTFILYGNRISRLHIGDSGLRKRSENYFNALTGYHEK